MSQLSGSTISATDAISSLLIRRRVPISILLIATLITIEVLTGIVPRQLFNLRDPLVWCGLGCLLFGLGMRSWAAGTLKKKQVVATTGPYAICRHPLYLGTLGLVIGFCMLYAAAWNLAIILPCLLIVYSQSIRSEEAYLSRHFGSTWSDYCQTTNRIIPTLPKISRLECGWSMERWVANREYQAVIGVSIALIAIATWSYRMM